MRGWLVHRERHLRARPVDRAGRGIDQMLDAVVATPSSHIERADHVAADVAGGSAVNSARPPARQRCTTRSNFSRSKNSRHRHLIGEVQAHKAEL